METMSRKPDAIQREIEATRAELARTVDLIAERLSPRRAASRGVTKVKAGIDGVLHGSDDNGDTGIRSVPLNGQPTPVRTLRKDRVALAVAAAAAVVGLIVVLRRRHH
jgi:uncharacterized protein DUF3618